MCFKLNVFKITFLNYAYIYPYKIGYCIRDILLSKHEKLKTCS